MDGRVIGRVGQAGRRLTSAAPAVAGALGVLSLLSAGGLVALEFVAPGVSSPTGTGSVVTDVAWLVFGLAFTVVGVVVARREPRNPMGWLLLGAALSIQIRQRRPRLRLRRLPLPPRIAAAGSRGGGPERGVELRVPDRAADIFSVFPDGGLRIAASCLWPPRPALRARPPPRPFAAGGSTSSWRRLHRGHGRPSRSTDSACGLPVDASGKTW